MITIDIPRHGIGAVLDEDISGYSAAQVLSAVRPAGELPPGKSQARALVEVQRRLGGLSPRALLGGEFIAGEGEQTRLEVAVSGFSLFDGTAEPTRSGRLWKRPFNLGLPEEFGSAVLSGVGSTEDPLPAGLLRVDRAGFDLVNSSEHIFEMAGSLLVTTIAAIVYGLNIEAEAKTVISRW